MMRFYKPIYLFIIIILLIVVYAAPGEEPEELGRFFSALQKAGAIGSSSEGNYSEWNDSEWNNTFEQKFTELYENSKINPEVFTLLSKALSGGSGGADISPEKYAQTLYRAARDADRGLRRGENPMKIREKMRNQFTRTEHFNTDSLPDAPDKAKDQVRNNLENRGRGNTSSFIPPGLDIRNKLHPPGIDKRDDVPFDRNDNSPGENPGADNNESGLHRP